MKLSNDIPNSTQISADWDDLLFEGRNKAYGSYRLRKKYHKWLLNSFLLAASVFISSILFWYLTYSTSGNENQLVAEAQEKLRLRQYTVESRKLSLDKIRDDAPLKRKPPRRATKHTLVASPISSSKPSLEAPNVSLTKKLDDSLESKNAGELRRELGHIKRDPVRFENKAFTSIQREAIDPLISYAEYPALPLNLSEVRQDIGFPDRAARIGLEGEVTVKVLVGEDGEYVRHVVEDFSHPIFLESCERHIKKLRFTPGKMGSEPVKVWVSIPFQFRM